MTVEIGIAVFLALLTIAFGAWAVEVRAARTDLGDQFRHAVATMESMKKDLHDYMMSMEQRLSRAEAELSLLTKMAQVQVERNHGADR
jgi:hypothetical protein